LGTIEKLRLRYSDRVDFYLIYTREAHPGEGAAMDATDSGSVCIPPAKTLHERMAAASELRRRADVRLTFLADSMDDAVTEAYSAFPDRIYLIDRAGVVAHKGGRGPHGFDPGSLETAIVLTLIDEDTARELAPAAVTGLRSSGRP
jgi:hypothetical protein